MSLGFVSEVNLHLFMDKYREIITIIANETHNEEEIPIP